TVFAGLSMVNNLRFYSFRDINLRKSVPFVFMLLLVLSFVLISVDPPTVLFSGFVAYALSGYVMWFWDLRKNKPVAGASPGDKSPPD
ncbi:MAG: CDP-diacylglycerol--serine O-phosphatidyltransferase, partial [Burkholderiales bacterium]